MSIVKKQSKHQCIYAIIPARAGSKRLKNKNIFPVLEKPMISYSINACLSSDYIDKVFVSSDSQDILDTAKELGALPFKRSKKNSGDHVYKQEAIIECLNQIKKEFNTPDLILSVQANSPEITSSILDKGIDKFLEFDRNELISVNKDLIQNAAIRIMKEKYVYQKTLSTKTGCFIADLIDVHTIEDVKKVESRMLSSLKRG
jgi:CMP-N,N'-diacetyllegionaminic acid synthase